MTQVTEGLIELKLPNRQPTTRCMTDLTCGLSSLETEDQHWPPQFLLLGVL